MTETEVMVTNIHVHTDSWVRVSGFITVTEGTMVSLAVCVYVGNPLLLWFSLRYTRKQQCMHYHDVTVFTHV